MPQISPPHFVGRRGAYGPTASGALAEGALLLDDNDYAISWVGLGMQQSEGLVGSDVVPIFACLFIRRFATHSTTAAPELSMQLSIVYKHRV